jgi:hypothetical protein
MSRRIFIIAVVIITGISAGCDLSSSVPPKNSAAGYTPSPDNGAPLKGTLDRVNVENNTLLLSTEDGTMLPPLTIGTDVKLTAPRKTVTSTGEEKIEYREVKAGEASGDTGRPVQIRFRDEGQRRVIDEVRIVKDQ